MTEETVARIIVMALGVVSLVWPDALLRLHVWSNKLLGARFSYSDRTRRIQRGIGAILIIVALFLG